MTPRLTARRVLIPLAVILAARIPVVEGATIGQWNVNGGGSWGDLGNWVGGMPQVAGDTATFGTFLTNPAGAVVTLDGDRTVASLNFNSTAGPYTLTQGTGGTLFMQGSTDGVSSLAINVAAGQHVLGVPVVANAALTINATSNTGSPATSLTISGSVSSSSSINFVAQGISVSKLEVTGSLAVPVGKQILFDSVDGAASVVTVNGGTLVGSGIQGTSAGLQVGSSNGAVSALRVNSGSVTVSGECWLGERSTNSSYAAFTQTGGAVTVSSWFVVGNSSDRAVFNMSGGTFHSSPLTIGAGFPTGNAVGVVNQSGGIINVGTVFLGEIGTGVVNISGSAVFNSAYIEFGGASGNVPIRGGDLNLLGGTITTGGLEMYYLRLPTRAVVNFNGGMLIAKASTASFVGGLSGVYVYAGGAFIDDGGNSITIQGLSAPTGSGVSNVPVAGGTGYIDKPLVQFTNAASDTTGAGACAVANIDSSGNITGITVTNPGTGYTKPPVATLVGGGGSGATVGSVTLLANTSGGLTKLGSGTLAISGNSTYTGQTNINSGTLVDAGSTTASSLGSGAIINGGVLAFLRSGNATISNLISGAGDVAQLAANSVTLGGTENYSGSTLITGGGQISFSGAALHAIGSVSGNGTLQVTGNATLTSDAVMTGVWVVNGTHVVRANGLPVNTSKISTLTLAGAADAWTGKLDLTNNGMIVGNGANVANQLKQGANVSGGGGAWNGTGGITSSAAMVAGTGSTATALAYAMGAAFTAGNGFTSFGGQSFLPTDTLVMYTLAGDGNMDGGVTFADFLALQNHYNSASDWEGGDFNYDGSTTFADFLILQNNYNKVLIVPGGAGSIVAGGAGGAGGGTGVTTGAVGGVPEPGSVGILLGGVWMLRRRGRNRR